MKGPKRPTPTHYVLCAQCSLPADRFNEARGKYYCRDHWHAMTPQQRGEVFEREPIARDRDGNLLRYPAGATVEECAAIREQMRQKRPKRTIQEALI